MEIGQTQRAWKMFTVDGSIMPEVPPMVATSWQRCYGRLNPTQKLQFNKLNPDTLLATQVASFNLISIARPILEDIYQNIKPDDVAIILLNGAGYILDMLAQPDIRAWLMETGICEGVLMTEMQVGTNAFGLALTERAPVEIIGAEHYCHQLHHIATAAAPIFDMTGHPLGVCGLISPLASYQSHSLGMMVAGARGIEAQRQADVLLAEQNSQLAQLNVIMDAITEGIIVWNEEGLLIHANNYAAQMLGVPIQRLLGRPIESIAAYPAFLIREIKKREPLTDVEANIKVGDQTLNCLLSLRYVIRDAKLEWVIMTMRPIREVRELVQRQVGAQAFMSLDDITGESAQIKRVHQFVRSTAAAGASILILGESGTGKNVLARAIHNESLRRDGPFLIFPCASMPGELVLSELVGYEEGAFLKRPGSRPSKFELAQGGTLYFQDIEALPLEAQSILLNVLELGLVQRLGSDRPIEVDVRVIASTSAKIEKFITASSFRSDLFYRLSTFSIHLPALRERPQDIPLIAERILKRMSLQLGRELEYGPGVLDALKRYSWSGNIRELEAVLGMAVAQMGTASSARASVIELHHITTTVRYLKDTSGASSGELLVQSMGETERDAILQAAHHCHGNLTRMAQVLGVGRTTLWRKVKRHKILLEDYRKNVEEVG